MTLSLENFGMDTALLYAGTSLPMPVWAIMVQVYQHWGFHSASAATDFQSASSSPIMMIVVQLTLNFEKDRLQCDCFASSDKDVRTKHAEGRVFHD
jgi:hypothetical protein